MKVRNGFVSNSSSSSFVVAFPKKPKSFANVYEIMFHSKDGGISVYDMEGMSHTQIAERVWSDLQRKQEDEWDDHRVPATEDDIVEQFANRYCYWSVSSCVSSLYPKLDEIGGEWHDEIGKYCGSDKDTLIELRDYIIATEDREREIRIRQQDIFKSEFKLRRPPYAYKGGSHADTKDPYTDEEIADFEAFRHASDKFKKEHKEYVKLEQELRDGFPVKNKKEHELRKKLAKVDAQEFMSDNKDAFFVTLSYADEGGEYTLEHGDIFRNLPYVRISNH